MITLETTIKAKQGYEYFVADASGDFGVYAPKIQRGVAEYPIAVMFMGGTTTKVTKAIIIIGLKVY